MSKKGFIGSALVDVWFIILFVFMLIVFFIIFGFLGPFFRASQEIKGEMSDINFAFSVVNFFRMASDKGTVQDLFYYYSKNLDDVYLGEMRQKMREFLPENVCIQIFINGEKISGDYFNDCGTSKLIDTYEFIDYETRRMDVQFYQLETSFFVKNINDYCSSLDKFRCLNWVGCSYRDGGCVYG